MSTVPEVERAQKHARRGRTWPESGVRIAPSTRGRGSWQWNSRAVAARPDRASSSWTNGSDGSGVSRFIGGVWALILLTAGP
jgi:hypothetical protein